MLDPNRPALVLAPMDGITDAPMRELQGAGGAFTYAVSEFVRVSWEVLPKKVFRREVPELESNGLTRNGMPVQVQILGGDPERMALSALNAVKAGAKGIDLNFGCPAPTVNRNDGGASLLKSPCRIREIVSAVRQAVPTEVPVSAKVRLGWELIEDVHENAAMAAEGGATWLTVHARTRVQGYKPPVFWPEIRKVRDSISIPVIANGDIWTIDDFKRCQDETGCIHFMIGRGALANPALPHQISAALSARRAPSALPSGWIPLFRELVRVTDAHHGQASRRSLLRLKQWLNLADKHGDFPYFDELKRLETIEAFFDRLQECLEGAAA